MADTDPAGFGPRFDYALLYAAQMHRSQVRKGTRVPYITHLMAVAAIVGEHGGGEDEVIAALLHDTVEDQGGQVVLETIRSLFGDAVADIVAACSDTDQDPKPPWCERKRAYLVHVGSLSESALLVSVADKLHNVRSVLADLTVHGDGLWGRFNAPKESQLWNYIALADAYRNRYSALQAHRSAGNHIKLASLLDAYDEAVDALLRSANTSHSEARAHNCTVDLNAPGDARS